jgi:hypothetical protein
VSDRIVLTVPADERFRGIATLVLGGLGSRLDLSYERMEDLQLAVLSVLGAAVDGSVTLDVEADGRDLRLDIGPVRAGSGADDGLRLVLSRLVDEVQHENRANGEWLMLRLAGAGNTEK